MGSVEDALARLTADGRGRPDLGPRPHRLEAVPRGDRGPPRLARRPRRDAVARTGADRVRRLGQGRRLPSRRPARDGRQQPGSGGAQGDPRERPRLPGAHSAGLDGARGRSGRDRGHRPRAYALPGLLEVGNDHRAQRAVPSLPDAGGPRDKLRRDHRSGHPARRARRARGLPAKIPQRGRHGRTLLGALVLRPRARGARRHRRRGAAGAGRGDGRALQGAPTLPRIRAPRWEPQWAPTRWTAATSSRW